MGVAEVLLLEVFHIFQDFAQEPEVIFGLGFSVWVDDFHGHVEEVFSQFAFVNLNVYINCYLVEKV